MSAGLASRAALVDKPIRPRHAERVPCRDTEIMDFQRSKLPVAPDVAVECNVGGSVVVEVAGSIELDVGPHNAK